MGIAVNHLMRYLQGIVNHKLEFKKLSDRASCFKEHQYQQTEKRCLYATVQEGKEIVNLNRDFFFKLRYFPCSL